MNRLNARIEKLEQEAHPVEPKIIILHEIVEGGHGMPLTKTLHDAVIPGVGRIVRNDESGDEFIRLAYAMSEFGKHIRDMSEDEMTAALIAADARIVRESEAKA